MTLCPGVFFTEWVILKIIWTQSLQENKDDISNQACRTAFLSFVTISNPVYQRKQVCKKKKKNPFVENPQEFTDVLDSQNSAFKDVTFVGE